MIFPNHKLDMAAILDTRPRPAILLLPHQKDGPYGIGTSIRHMVQEKMMFEYMGESSKFPKSRAYEIQIFKLARCLQK